MLIKIIRQIFISIFPCEFHEMQCHSNMLGCKCGKKGERPSVPQFQLPEYARGLPNETLALIRSQVGKQSAIPEEFDLSSQLLQQLAGTSADQFQFPVQDIQNALASQQAIQLEDFQKQIRPLLAAQGQLDSSAHTNLLCDFLQGQQSQALGTTADVLTQQALNNLQLQQFIPQFQSGIAGQLAGVGGQRAALDQFNLTLPFQTTIPAFQQQFGLGLQQGDAVTKQANLQFQSDLAQFNDDEARRRKLIQGAAALGTAALTGGLSSGAGFLPGVTSFGGGGALLGAQGVGAGSFLGAGGGGGTGNFRFNPSRGLSQQSRILGFDTRAFS